MHECDGRAPQLALWRLAGRERIYVAPPLVNRDVREQDSAGGEGGRIIIDKA